MKKLLFILLLLPFFGLSQTTGFFRYDTIRFQKVGASSEFILENATKGNTNAFLQNYSQGRTRFAFALDSVWIDGDSIRFRYGGTTLAVLAGASGSTETASEGLSKVGDDIKLGGPLTAPAPLLSNRRIDLNGKSLYFTKGTITTDSADFSYRYTPFNVASIDSITSNEPGFDVVPKHLMNVNRTIRYVGGYRKANIGNFKGQMTHQAGDSAVIRTDGSDYQYGVMGETRLMPLAEHTGRTVFRTGHGTNENLKLNQVPFGVIGNMFIDSTDGTKWIRVNGGLGGIQGYLAMTNGAADSIDFVVYVSANSVVSSPAWVKKAYAFAPAVYWNRVDSAFLFFDTARNASSGNPIRAFWRAKTKIGGDDSWVSPYQFAVGGSSYFADSIVHGQRLSVSDTTGIDIMVRDRTTGILKYITADDLGVGGGTPGLDDVLAEGQTLTANRDIPTDDKILKLIGSSSETELAANHVGVYATDGASYGLSATSTASHSVGPFGALTSKASTDTEEQLGVFTRESTGTPAAGIGGKVVFQVESSTGSNRMSTEIGSVWADPTDASRTSEINIRGVDNATTETFMNIQKDLVRINNNADTLATKAYARSVGSSPAWGNVEAGAITSTDFGLADVNTDQTLFPSCCDAYTLAGNTTYEFEALFYVSTGNGNVTLATGFSLAGGASITSMLYDANSWVTAGSINSAATSQATTTVDQATTTVVTVSSASTQKTIHLKGMIRMNAGGTVTPILKFSAAPGTTGGSNNLKANSWIKFVKAGSGSVTTVGNVN